ncbi:hypothetical protein ABZZ47_34890 [Streptomyces sp. NPDC006465]|uniref:hypothetical protein n=1 Tax=Streptomyces sp. NPDC006465 TaxID=3157174 RepID=UPI0033BCEA90
MSEPTRVDPRGERPPRGNPSSATRTVPLPAAWTVDPVRLRSRGTVDERMRLPDGKWRRVETIRVPNLFG